MSAQTEQEATKASGEMCRHCRHAWHGAGECTRDCFCGYAASAFYPSLEEWKREARMDDPLREV